MDERVWGSELFFFYFVGFRDGDEERGFGCSLFRFSLEGEIGIGNIG